MTPRRAIVAALALLVIAVVVWKMRRVAPSAAPTKPIARSQGVASPNPAPAAAPADVSQLADSLNAPASNPRADLKIVGELIEAFRTNFPQSGNPVGDNQEITAALSGKNKLRLALIPPNHPAINRDGELCDRWGTPFFFHAESATKMGVRSAGPDKKMWTADDVILEP